MDSHVLRYGQNVRLATRSAYVEESFPSVSELGIGYYEKNGRHGVLSCVPPLGPKLQHFFTEDAFLVLHPSNQRTEGDKVFYGDALVLVNQRGMVWNNKTGGITGYIGPRPRGVPGEIFVSFIKVPEGVRVTKSSKKEKGDKADRRMSSSSALSISGSSPMSEVSEATTEPICFGDTNVAIEVVESNRHSQMFNKRLSNFKKPTSRIMGGYICCDGKGTELRFTIWPMKPTIEQISMLNKLITPYNYGQKIALPLGLLEGIKPNKANVCTDKAVAEIIFKLSNGAIAVLPGSLLQKKMLDYVKPRSSSNEEPDSLFEVPLQNGPGVLVVRLTGIAPQQMITRLIVKNEKHLPVTKISRGMTIFHLVSGTLRRVPVPVFALFYAMLTHHLWGALSIMDDGLRREFVVLVLVIVPTFYVAVKMDHPFSSLFHPPVSELVADSSDYSSSASSGSLKLTVTEYRFANKFQNGSDATKSVINSSLANAAFSRSITTFEATGIVPARFILAEKGDEAKAMERYNETTEWRRSEGVDLLLEKPNPHFKIIKNNYPHYYHKRGKEGEPVYYEKPGKINLKALKSAGLALDDLMHNYLMITEFLWQVIEQDDNRKGISVLDVDGIGLSDFAGEAVEYVRKAALVSGKHYPERCAYIYVINVPSWFSIIWNTVKGMVDDVTREKVIIVRGKKKILEALSEHIPVENIPAEYGGMSDGKAPEEDLLLQLMAYVNNDENASANNPIEEILKKKPMRH
ncbi:uncharacterized protein CCR75_001924 [Bremia lactucae]|uniref:CRAL-TRIO domain-containing protein n=1 Tax=Bremia lactucae TaxID=4779 RepID=A0A976FQI0_BRELC|nr:hypothetical protein CCR75_001924 [Bremia lactucae]